MQKTRFRQFINLFISIINPLFADTWKKRSILLTSLLTGFYFTNSLISFLLDKSVNTIILALSLLITMEILIRISNFTQVSIILTAINNFRIGSTYALILEAYKLGS